MLERHARKLIVAGVAVAAVAGAAGAVAATGALSPRAESQAVVNDAARQLGVEPSELTNALEQALKNRVDAAVAAGRLTEEQGAELKERIDAGDYPLLGFGPRGHGHFGHFGGDLDAAASYLGVSEAELRTALMEGRTLAEGAQDEGKSVEGLVAALVAAETEELEQAVEDGRLTEAQKDAIAATLEERVNAKVNGELRRGHHGRFGFGPPPFDGDDDSAPRAPASLT